MPGRILAERINIIRKELGWSQEVLAEKSGLPYETIKNICTGRTPDPKVSTVMALSEATGFAMNCLMGKCNHTSQERFLLRNYRSCGPHGKSIIEFIAKYEASAVKSDREAKDKHKIPCLVPHGDIYKGIVYDNCETTEIETSVPEAFVAIQMVNNDLAPIYCKNDFILLENRFPASGEYAAFFKGGKAYIRKFIEENGVYRLKCLHNQGEDMVFKRMDEIEYIGTCIDVIRT